MNWIGVVLITVLVYLIAIPVFGIVLGALPPWV